MKRSTLVGSMAACFCFGLAGPLLAAGLPASGAVNHPSPSANVTAARPAEKCLSDLRAFNSQMGKDGYWLGGSGNAYGYPIDGLEYGRRYRSATTATSLSNLRRGYQLQVLDARPGYEVRTLVASADILARHGQQQPCEDVLATTRGVYKLYVADMHNGGVPMVNVPAWRLRQIAAAQPIANKDTSFRSDELLGADVFNPHNEVLGSIDDLVTRPGTGRIAYLVIGRGGIFGIDKKYIPVPWADFKATPNVSLLVLDASNGDMNAAPQVSDEQFASPSRFDQQSHKVDAYWKARLPNKDDKGSNG